METTEEQAKVLEAKRQKSFWFADWSFPLIVGIMPLLYLQEHTCM